MNLLSTVASVAILPDPCSLSQPLHRPQLRATGWWIIPNFRFRRPYDVAGEQPRSARLRHGLKTLLDLAILERHEGDDHRASSRLQQPGDGCEQRVQLFHFAIHRDAQRQDRKSTRLNSSHMSISY